jgi:hypothetical protein
MNAIHVPSLSDQATSALLHSDALSRPLCASANLALHLLRVESASVGAGLRIVALRVALLAAETELLVLLCPLVVGSSVFASLAATVAAGLGVGFESDVEEVFLVGVGDVRTRSFCCRVSLFSVTQF